MKIRIATASSQLQDFDTNSHLRVHRWIKILTIGMLICAGSNLPAQSFGQEFRIDSHVYAAESSVPVSHNVTLFTPKLVCDFLMSDDAEPKPIEMVVFDTRTKEIVLLDPDRKMRTELSDLHLLKLVDGLRRETEQNEAAKFLITDVYTEDTDWTDGWVTVSSPNISYRFHGQQPADVTTLPKYFDFLDHFTRLNASDPTKFPPFPRMQLNRMIKKLGWMPDEVQIVVAANSLFKETFKATSKHSVTNVLTEKDRALIELAKKNWMAYENVNLAVYRRLDKESQEAKLQKSVVSEKELKAMVEQTETVDNSGSNQSATKPGPLKPIKR